MTPSRAKLELNLTPETREELRAIALKLQRSPTWVLLTALRLAMPKLELMAPPTPPGF